MFCLHLGCSPLCLWGTMVLGITQSQAWVRHSLISMPLLESSFLSLEPRTVPGKGKERREEMGGFPRPLEWPLALPRYS